MAARATALPFSLCPKGHKENNQLLVSFAYNQDSGGVQHVNPQQEFSPQGQGTACAASGTGRHRQTATWAGRAGRPGARSRGGVYPKQKGELSLHRGTRSTLLPSHMLPHTQVFVGRSCSGCSLPVPGPEEQPDCNAAWGPWAWPGPGSIAPPPPRTAQPVTQTHSSCPDTEPSLLPREHCWRGRQREGGDGHLPTTQGEARRGGGGGEALTGIPAEPSRSHQCPLSTPLQHRRSQLPRCLPWDAPHTLPPFR